MKKKKKKKNLRAHFKNAFTPAGFLPKSSSPCQLHPIGLHLYKIVGMKAPPLRTLPSLCLTHSEVKLVAPSPQALIVGPRAVKP